MEEVFVGIDISKDNFEICVKNVRNITLMDGKKYPFTKDGFQRFEKDLQPYQDLSNCRLLFGMESTGIYHKVLEEHIEQMGYKTTGVNSGKAANYLPGFCKQDVVFANINKLIEVQS